MTLPVVFTANGPSGYNLTNSLRFRSSASAKLSRTVSSGTASTKGTYSVWVKRGKDYDSNNNGTLVAAADTYNYAQFYQQTLYFGNTTNYMNTAAVYRDYASWYHVFFVFDTTLATSTDRLQIWVNGVRQTAGSVTSYPSLNASFPFLNSAQAWYMGGRSADAWYDGYMAELNYVDGQALPVTAFGSFNALTGVWQPAKYTGTYGTNGFYLPFTNTTSTTTLGYDFSGNSNNWTTNNLSLTTGSTYDSMTDVPTLTSATTANYCVWNPLKARSTTLLTNGNLSVSSSDAGSAYCAFTSIVMSSQKWYAEYTVTTSTGGYPNIGIGDLVISENSNRILGDTNGASYQKDGTVYINGTNVGSFASFTNGDVIGVAYDATNNRLYFAKNNTWINSGDPASGTGYFSPASPVQGYVFATSLYSAASLSSNFGQQPFSYTPPTGFVALNTYNLPTSTIVKGNTVMDATTYTGNGGTQSVVNAAPFKPDFVWIKQRSGTGYHVLEDTVRGATKNLSSNSTDPEATIASGLTSFNSNGFSLGSNGDVNASAGTYVGWQWQAGQGTNTTNTAGSITSTVSVNASAGFSVVTYTGTGANATVGHGLGVAPSMVIVKSRSDSSTYWCVYQSAMWATSGTDYTLLLPLTNGAASRPTLFNSTQPSSTVFSIGTNGGVNNNGSTYVAYCWSAVAGYSAFGIYTGNGSADGAFVYTGFRPKFVLMKATTGSNNWIMYDTARNTYNLTNLSLVPDSSAAENGVSGTTENTLDILSNGFKLRTSNALNNGSSVPYIYMAFAENPFKNALAR